MDVQSIVKSGTAALIDVREVSEFIEDHIEGALNYPLSRFQDFVEDIKAIEGPKVLYCRSGMRSGQAMGYLQSLGVNDVYNGGSLVMMKTFVAV